MATKSADKKDGKVKVKSKKKKAVKKSIKKTTSKKVAKKIDVKSVKKNTTKKTLTKKVAPKVKVKPKKPAKKVKKTTSTKVAGKNVLRKPTLKKMEKKGTEKIIQKAKVVAKPVEKKTAKQVKNVASAVYDIKSPVSKTKKINQKNWVLENRIFILVVFIAVVIMNSWIFLTTPQYTPTISEQQIANPVFDDQASYYKYEISQDQWEGFDIQNTLKQMVSSGVRFDEAIYQEGGQACDVCPTNATPLLFLKNPSHLSGRNWTQVAKPGFYENTTFYPIYQYLLRY